MKEVKFNSKSLLNIKFKSNVKGYDPLEVDQTLDEIIKDYEIIEKKLISNDTEIAKLDSENKSLKDKVRSYEVELEKVKTELKSIPTKLGYNKDNLALLKRIDALERALYQKGVDPKKI